MNNDDALFLLGIEGELDGSALRHAYERRRLECQQRLSNAATEGLKQKYHVTLNDLDQAYNLLLQSTEPPTLRRGANASNVQRNASTGGTMLRAEQSVQPPRQGLQTGHVLANRYEIRRVLGQGGMGAVYEAFDRLKQELIAIKVLLPQYLNSEQGRARFMHEAKIACRLSHPNIVKVFDVGLDESYYFITMELLEGRTLRDHMDETKAGGKQYTVQHVIAYAKQLIAALEYAHKQIVHRDLKPENVWMCADGTLKLIDFGIARAFTNSALTRTGMVMGTAYYMAPEQFNGAKDVGWQADQYSLAVMLYELLTGRLPQGTFATTSELRRDVSLAMSRALMKALAPEPQSRFESLAAFNAALTEHSSAPFFSRKRLFATAAVAASVTVVLVAGWVWQNRGPTAETSLGETQTSPPPALAEIENKPVESPESLATTATEKYQQLHDKKKNLSAAIDRQQAEHDRLLKEWQNADAAAKKALETQGLQVARELQIAKDLQDEWTTKVFTAQRQSKIEESIRAGQILAKNGEPQAAAGKFAEATSAISRDLQLADDIQAFVRARQNYFDAKQQWIDYSVDKLRAAPPRNPSIARTESGIKASIDRNEYADLAKDRLPKLTAMYVDELRTATSAPRTANQSSSQAAAADDDVDESADDEFAAWLNSNANRQGVQLTPRQQARQDKVRIKEERRRASILAKCAKSGIQTPECVAAQQSP
jgi:hypothetical protein